MKLNATAEITKNFNAKRGKEDKKGESIVMCSLKFSALMVTRDEGADLVGLKPEIMALFYDELGAPHAAFTVSTKKRILGLTGVVSFNTSRLTLGKDSQLADIEVTLKSLGALLEGTLQWSARGDEVEDVAELLGRTCLLELDVSGPVQKDLFKDAKPDANGEGTEEPAKPKRKSARRDTRARGRGNGRPSASH